MAFPTMRRVLATAVLAALAVLAVPPAAGGDTAPPTVMRAVRVAADSLVPAATATAIPPAARDRWTRARTVCAPITFTMAALTWRHAGAGHVDVDLRWGSRRAMGAAVRLEAEPADAPDPGSREDTGIGGTAPVWTGEATCIRFRLHLEAGDRLAGIRAVFLNTSGTATGRSPLAAVGSALARIWHIAGPDPAAAVAPRPGIIGRRTWGADERLRRCGPDYADELRMAYVHHTATGNTYPRSRADDVIRGIYAYHVHARGFCDIAYNFLVDRFGRIYEGRYGGMARPVIGGHAMGFNTGSAGIAAIGDFTRTEPPARMLRAITRLLAWRLDAAHQRPGGTVKMVSRGGSNQRFRRGETVVLPIVSGHRDTGYTSCPGDRLYARLPQLRRDAEALGDPKMYRPRASTTHIAAGEESVRYVARLSQPLDWFVSIRDLDGLEVTRLTGTSALLDATWDGTDELGLPVAEGTYAVKLGARDAATRALVRPRWFTLTVAVPIPEPEETMLSLEPPPPIP